MSKPEIVSLSTQMILFELSKKAFSLGFEQALNNRKRFSQAELFESIGFYDLRGFHKKTVWLAYRSGRFEAATSFKVKAKY
ncbi:hypothetical protein [Pseudoalteromonas luteoviolacea]|uniref:Uncharacterized protein n=1 Tax=Pseudoalteromonas luteoviolacea S4060-1 TaxID=1365257 RepID=A0A167KV50_9GAMM|nr:hypothetical protein [Pseudoalteromonas luteoviolacea]KZN63328.1 hypothetical protein N478_03500 [Pseudoalteromonas luteoviolacea S4060-1]